MGTALKAAPSRFEWSPAEIAATGARTDQLAVLQELLKSDFPHTTAAAGVIKDRMVFNYHKEGVSADALSPIYSITKSVLALLVGIARDRGYLPSLDRAITAYFPEIDLSAADPRVQDIRIRHLLTMTSGWETATTNGKPPQKTLDGLLRKFDADPGTIFSYDNNSSNILGILLARAVGVPLEQFATEALFQPLGISQWRWRQTADGFPATSGGLFMSLEDVMRFGRLVMRRGDWNGQRIISPAYLGEAMSPQCYIGPSARAVSDSPYGYLWFMQKTPDGKHDGYAAFGYAGQVLYVVPALELIVATTTLPNPEGKGGMRMIRNLILPTLPF